MDISKQLWLAGIDAEERARLERWGNAWAWYNEFGNNPKPLTVKPNQANDNVTINYARLIVNTAAS